jgi:excinuclease ABC subunit C
MDMILTAQSSSGYHIILFFVRNGKLSGRESFHMEDAVIAEERGSLTAGFIKQYYTEDMMIPKEIAVEYEPEDAALLEQWLSDIRKSKVRVFVPQKGEKHALLEMARRDVVEMMKVLDDRAAAKTERENAVSSELNRVFGEKRRRMKLTEAVRAAESPEKYDEDHCSWRIESYDISNIAGVDSVGGMVVFENGRPQRKAYRKFKIKTVDGPDDYSSMQEVIYRRFRRAEKGDAGFAQMPDIIFVDGGLGHVHAVQEVLSAMRLHIIVAGMVKDDRHRTRGLIVDGQEIDLKERPVLFRYVTTIQDEVHRFAIDYHHGIRNRSMQKSVLDNAPGIGEKRKKSLLSRFGSIENIRKATVEELAETEGMTVRAAESLMEYLKNMQ